MTAIIFWLKHHHTQYATRVEVTAEIRNAAQDLTPEQEALVREALRLSAVDQQKLIKPNTQNNEQPNNEQQKTDPAGTGGNNDQGQKSPSGDH